MAHVLSSPGSPRSFTPGAAASCPIVEFFSLVSGKWAVPILFRLIGASGPMRFRELQRAAAPITQKELTKQLRLLESRGLVRRTVFAELPARVEYEAVDAAASLLESLESFAAEMCRQGGLLGSSGPT